MKWCRSWAGPSMTWRVREANRIPFDPTDVLHPGERRMFSGSTIAWNNGGDSVRLIDPRGHVSHAIAYGSVKAGRAVCSHVRECRRRSGAVSDRQATPGGENRCADLPVVAKRKSTATKNKGHGQERSDDCSVQECRIVQRRSTHLSRYFYGYQHHGHHSIHFESGCMVLVMFSLIPLIHRVRTIGASEAGLSVRVFSATMI
jgi:hypothetical protein